MYRLLTVLTNQRIILTEEEGESPKEMFIPSVRGDSWYVNQSPFLTDTHFDTFPLLQAKSGFKTRRTNNPNRWVVTEKPRNHGKRRIKTGT